MNIQDYKNTWVLVETANGEAINASLELIKQGKVLAEANGEKVVAVVIGQNVDAAVKSATSFRSR